MKSIILSIFSMLLILGCSNKEVEKKEYKEVKKNEFLVQPSDIAERGEYIHSIKSYELR